MRKTKIKRNKKGGAKTTKIKIKTKKQPLPKLKSQQSQQSKQSKQSQLSKLSKPDTRGMKLHKKALMMRGIMPKQNKFSSPQVDGQTRSSMIEYIGYKSPRETRYTNKKTSAQTSALQGLLQLGQQNS
jgi:hypothetical protein